MDNYSISPAYHNLTQMLLQWKLFILASLAFCKFSFPRCLTLLDQKRVIYLSAIQLVRNVLKLGILHLFHFNRFQL
jgi:hypothetical protein